MPPRLPPGRHVTLGDGTQTLVRHFGTSTGTPLLLIHGWWVTADLNWGYNYQALACHHPLITFDLPGHGRGSDRPERFTLEQCVADAVHVLDACDVPQAVGVGYSMGGCVAQLLARDHPDRVPGQILCATSRNFRGAGWERARFAVLPGVAGATRLAPASVMERAFAWGLPKRMHLSAMEQWATHQIGRGNLQRLLEAGTALYHFNSAPWVDQLDLPTAVVVTSQDRTVPPSRQHKLAASLRGSTLHEVAGNHEVCITAPDRFSPVLLAAAEKVLGRPNGY